MQHTDGRCTKCLVDAGFDVNVVLRSEDDDDFPSSCAETLFYALDYELQVTPLTAVGMCNYSLQNAHILLDAGASVNARTNREVPPLFAAMGAGNTDLAKLLIERGALVNVRNPSVTGNMLILFAVHHWDTLNLALRAGAEVHDLFTPCPLYVEPVPEDVPEELRGFNFCKVKAVIEKSKMLIENHNLRSDSAEVQDAFLSELDDLSKQFKATKEITDDIHTMVTSPTGQSSMRLSRTAIEEWAGAVSKVGASAMQLCLIALHNIGRTPHIGMDLAKAYLKPRTDFHRFLRDIRCKRRLEDGKTENMTAFQVLWRILQVTGNVPLDLTLAAVVDTQEEWSSLVTLIGKQLAQCCSFINGLHSTDPLGFLYIYHAGDSWQ